MEHRRIDIYIHQEKPKEPTLWDGIKELLLMLLFEVVWWGGGITVIVLLLVWLIKGMFGL
jgi:hypothetical protein